MNISMSSHTFSVLCICYQYSHLDSVFPSVLDLFIYLFFAGVASSYLTSLPLTSFSSGRKKAEVRFRT